MLQNATSKSLESLDDRVNRRHLRNDVTCSRHFLVYCGPSRPDTFQIGDAIH